MGLGGLPENQPEPREQPVTPPDNKSGIKTNNSLYLSVVAIVAIIAVTIIAWNASANSSAVTGLINLATAAVGGMAGVALQKRQD